MALLVPLPVPLADVGPAVGDGVGEVEPAGVGDVARLDHDVGDLLADLGVPLLVGAADALVLLEDGAGDFPGLLAQAEGDANPARVREVVLNPSGDVALQLTESAVAGLLLGALLGLVVEPVVAHGVLLPMLWARRVAIA